MHRPWLTLISLFINGDYSGRRSVREGARTDGEAEGIIFGARILHILKENVRINGWTISQHHDIVGVLTPSLDVVTFHFM